MTHPQERDNKLESKYVEEIATILHVPSPMLSTLSVIIIFISIISTSLYIYGDTRIERANQIRARTWAWSPPYSHILHRWSMINICKRDTRGVQ